jgi:hypothetical protein
MIKRIATKPRTREAPKRAARKNGGNEAPASIPDLVFALIDAHKARTKEWLRLYSKLDKAQLQAGETHGPRPWELIEWRNYSAIGGQEIDDRRKEFLNQPGADRKQVEKEFRDANAREAAAEQAGASHVGTLTGPARFRASLKVRLCSSAPLRGAP